jgi:predicted TPR repeat methyltransferase
VQFDHVVSCGVFHFVSDLESIFSEVSRVLRADGMFAFTTKAPSSASNKSKHEKQVAGDFEIFSHLPQYVQSLLDEQSFKRIKVQKCFVGEDIFNLWVVQKI